METLETAPGFMDDLLDFASDIGEDEDEEYYNKQRKPLSSLDPNGLDPAPLDVLDPDHPSCSLPEFAEEELEWLSNKDAFPALETFVDILSDHQGSVPKQQSPVSVLENSATSSSSTSNSAPKGGGCSSSVMNYCGSLRVPVKARSKRHRRRRLDLHLGQQLRCLSKENCKDSKPAARVSTMGRKCQHCGAEKTPQWRAGPLGPKTLCNACGVRFKSGRLVPEYRPASSPTFRNELHSNSHRKVLEMRRQKQLASTVVVKPRDKG
uniref:GATA-type domain-containing protein n=1 Tax=Rhizophora mucronata TaxID=61149 RepID=A0A2P2J8Z5_RHIMU